MKREARQLRWAEPNLLPDMQALKTDRIILHHFALHQEFISFVSDKPMAT